MSGRRLVAFLTLACAIATCARAAAADFTVPPRPSTELVDAAGALSAATRTALESELESFESATGHHVIVYVGQTTGNVPLETWTAETAQTWRVGQKGKDDGAVLFLFMQDHRVRIEVGYGLESTLTDASASRIINATIVPRMKSGDTDGAVTAGTTAILTTIDPDFTPTYAPPASTNGDTDDSGDNYGLLMLVFVLVMLVIAIVVVMQIYTAIRYGYLIVREGRAAADEDMRKSWIHSFAGGTAGFFSGSSGGGFSGGGFSGGSFGGSFGGGGASGSW